MKKTLLLLTVALAGCAYVRTTHAPDGQEAYTINCSGMVLSWDACYAKAGDLCGTAGYQVLAGGSDTGMIVAANSSSLFGGSTISRSMLVECKRSL